MSEDPILWERISLRAWETTCGRGRVHMIGQLKFIMTARADTAADWQDITTSKGGQAHCLTLDAARARCQNKIREMERGGLAACSFERERQRWSSKSH